MLKDLYILMFKNLLFVMSLSGTVVFVFYLLLYPFMKPYVSLKWKYRILKIAMMFYLIPFPLCKYYVWGFIYDHFYWIWEIASRYEPAVMNTEYIIVAGKDSIKLSPKVQSIYVAVSFIVLISFFILGKQITQYRKMKQICFSDWGKPADEGLERLFSQKKAILNIKRDVKFICSEYCKSPITGGIWPPTIVFPMWDKDSMADEELCGYMIKHELVHIKHNDVLIKLTGLLVVAVHWFNPFSYLLLGELSAVSEMYSDSVVMEGKGEEERRKYGELLLKLITENVPFHNRQFEVGFANFRKKNMYKRRILEMKRNKKYKVFLSIIMTAFICMAGGITVFAYHPPDTITDESDEEDDSTEFFITTEPTPPEKLLSDYFAVSEDGTFYDLCLTDETVRKVCEHNYLISTEVTKHTRDSKGGCMMKTYEGLKCTKCMDIKSGNLLSTLTYVSCPH